MRQDVRNGAQEPNRDRGEEGGLVLRRQPVLFFICVQVVALVRRELFLEINAIAVVP